MSSAPVATITSMRSGLMIPPPKPSLGCRATSPVASTRTHVRANSSAAISHVSHTVTTSSSVVARRMKNIRPSSPRAGEIS